MDTARHRIRNHFTSTRRDLSENDQLWMTEIGNVLSSLEMLEFLAFLEQEFEIKVEEAKVNRDTFGSLDAVVRFIEAAIGERHSP